MVIPGEARARRADNLGYWCEEPVVRDPGRIALIDLSTEAPREVSYGELDARMNRVASLLAGRGLNPGDRLAMAVGNRFEFIEIMYGAMRAGLVPVPLNTRLGVDSLRYIVRDAGCVAAVVEPRTCPAALEAAVAGAVVERWAFDPVPDGWARYEEALATAPDRFEPPALPADHPAFQPYTSGSTGRPKGVVLTHAGQLWWIRALNRYWPEKGRERALAAVPLYHKNAMAGAIKPLLHVGGSVVILPDFEPRRFLRTLAGYRCTQAGAVPAVFTRLLEHGDLIERLDFSALRSLSIGSAPVQTELVLAVRQAFGVPVRESYGLTEGGPVMIGPPVDGRDVPPGSCGVAWPEGDVKLVSADGAEHAQDGELWVRNPGVTPGYYRLPEVNRARIQDGWLATGDLFHRDADGFFYFRGRTDDMFKSGGETVYPKEVENLLLAHGSVSDAAVVPVPHPVKGHVPVAMVLRRDGATVDEAGLRAFCLETGPAYAHPRRILFVDEMPLNGPGKIDRREVRRRLHEAFADAIATEGRV